MGGGFIETAISLSLLYLMISLLCTIVVELGASWLKARSRWLEHALRSLLYVNAQAWSGLAASPPAGLPPDKVARLDALVGYFKKQQSLFDHFADHPLIGKQPDRPQQGIKGPYISGNFPSYLTATTFAQAVVDILTPGRATVSVDDIRDAAAALPDCNFKRSLESLLKVAGDNLDKF